MDERGLGVGIAAKQMSKVCSYRYSMIFMNIHQFGPKTRPDQTRLLGSHASGYYDGDYDGIMGFGAFTPRQEEWLRHFMTSDDFKKSQEYSKHN